MYLENRKRALIKTVSWRIIATFITASIVYVLTGRIDIAVFAGGIEMVMKIIFYYLHERLWNKIRFGRRQVTPFVLWFTGLSGSGKSTISDRVYGTLKENGYRVERLDGDTVRSIFPSTGFSRDERNTHIRRIGYMASILEKNGVIVIASFVSPYRESRDFVRGLCGNFIEVYANASVEACEERDVKGLYKKARAGEIKNFTGIDDPYEPPETPELVIDTGTEKEEESLKRVMMYIKKYLEDGNSRVV